VVVVGGLGGSRAVWVGGSRGDQPAEEDVPGGVVSGWQQGWWA
jgi:hypothetical protein